MSGRSPFSSSSSSSRSQLLLQTRHCLFCSFSHNTTTTIGDRTMRFSSSLPPSPPTCLLLLLFSCFSNFSFCFSASLSFLKELNQLSMPSMRIQTNVFSERDHRFSFSSFRCRCHYLMRCLRCSCPLNAFSFSARLVVFVFSFSITVRSDHHRDG